ncbi:hypothetical protein [Burkholderia pyrrocinia]|uniref:hypothetical protein n=1 Tax=Burkholderia pyrrocinia TaxID=60550 RepID=UPI00158985C9|nr:hypothetical protein [Burkholderia pyrrocinia]
MIQSYDIQIPAGGTQILEVGAQIFDFVSSGSAFDVIQVLPEFQQGNVSLKVGQGFDAGKVVNRWFVKNTSTTAINGTAVLSTAGFRNFRISGDVNVLDGSKSRTLANNAYVGFTSVGAVAAQYSRVQLWNPSTNPNRLVLRALLQMGSGNAADSLLLYGQNAALATLAQQGQPKLIGGTQSNASIRSDSTATAPSVATADLLFGLSTTVTIAGWSPTEPVVIPPGWGLTVWSSASNLGIGAAFEWYEEPNT